MFKDFYLNIILEGEDGKDRGFLPVRSLDGDAGFDVFSPIDFTIYVGCDYKLPLNFRCEFPKGYGLLFVNKSGRAVKNKIINGAQLIDSNYRGICHAHVFNLGRNKIDVSRGEKISQFIVVPMWHGTVTSVEKFINTDTERGNGAFGHTGLK